MSTDKAPSAGWMPEACTLPTAQMPLRAAEFDGLFAESLHAADRLDAITLRLTLTGGAPVEGQARDLAARETQCCSFFAFDVDRRGETVVMEVRVPPAYVEVLDGLAALATSARPS